jgi:hypothetical protein
MPSTSSIASTPRHPWDEARNRRPAATRPTRIPFVRKAADRRTWLLVFVHEDRLWRRPKRTVIPVPSRISVPGSGTTPCTVYRAPESAVNSVGDGNSADRSQTE